MKHILTFFSFLIFVQSVDAAVVLDLRNQQQESRFNFGIAHKNTHFQHRNYANFYASKNYYFQYCKKLSGNQDCIDLITNFESIDHDLAPFFSAKRSVFWQRFKIISSLPQLLENTFLIAKKRPSTVLMGRS